MAIKPSHAMRNNMRLLSTIQQSPIEGVVDLIAELVTSELDAPRWVKLGHQNGESLRPEVLSHSAKVLNTEFFAEPENSMNTMLLKSRVRRLLARGRSFRQLKFAFLNEQSRSNVLARLNQVHGFCRRVQAEDVFVRFMDVFDSKYFLLADSLYAVF